METSQPTNQMNEGQPAPLLSGKRVMIILGGAIVLLLLVLTISGAQKKQVPSPSETATSPSPAEEPSPTPVSSGVYTNSQLGIQFSYPPQVMVNNVSSDIITVSTSNEPADQHVHESVTGMQISIFNGNKVADQLDLAKDLFNKPTTKDITVNGIPAKELSGYGVGMLEGKYIKFVEIYTGGKTYELSYFEGEPGFTKEDFDQILASFKVTK